MSEEALGCHPTPTAIQGNLVRFQWKSNQTPYSLKKKQATLYWSYRTSNIANRKAKNKNPMCGPTAAVLRIWSNYTELPEPKDFHQQKEYSIKYTLTSARARCLFTTFPCKMEQCFLPNVLENFLDERGMFMSTTQGVIERIFPDEKAICFVFPWNL